MQSKATTVEQYLAEAPEDRRDALSAVRKIILDNLDGDFEEGMQYGMIGYFVPHRVYPAGYHCDPKQPLPFACLASQKNYMSLYLMTVYGEGSDENQFRRDWEKTGKKLDMGKSCIRFKKLDDLALDIVANAIRRVTVKKYIEFYESAFKNHRKSSTKAKSTGTKKSVKVVATKKIAKKTTVKKKPNASKRSTAKARK